MEETADADVEVEYWHNFIASQSDAVAALAESIEANTSADSYLRSEDVFFLGGIMNGVE